MVDLRCIEEGYPKWPTGSGFHPVGHMPPQVRVLPLPPDKPPHMSVVCRGRGRRDEIVRQIAESSLTGPPNQTTSEAL